MTRVSSIDEDVWGRIATADADEAQSQLGTQAEAAFLSHLRDKARALRERYGRTIDAAAIRRMLCDPQALRWPVTLHIGAAPLQPGEFAFATPLGFHPGEGYALFVHPWVEENPHWLPRAVALHIPVINYGPVVQDDLAIEFGAALLGLTPQAYHDDLCFLADAVAAHAIDSANSPDRQAITSA